MYSVYRICNLFREVHKIIQLQYSLWAIIALSAVSCGLSLECSGGYMKVYAIFWIFVRSSVTTILIFDKKWLLALPTEQCSFQGWLGRDIFTFSCQEKAKSPAVVLQTTKSFKLVVQLIFLWSQTNWPLRISNTVVHVFILFYIFLRSIKNFIVKF